MIGGFWLSVLLVVALTIWLVLSLRDGQGDPDLDWRGRDLRDLETGDHRKPKPAWWKRFLRRR